MGMMDSMMCESEGACCATDTMFETAQGGERTTAMMPVMVMEMMPHCLAMMLPKLPEAKRTDFIVKMFKTLIEQGAAGTSARERKNLADRVSELLAV